MHKFLLALLFAMFAMAVFEVARAEPPAHAPAHGWRKKNDPSYVGYTGTKWERDYQVASGSCNREEIGAVIGGVIGGVVGAKNSSPDRIVAVIVGAAAGALIGSRIGRALDDADRGCFGHVLEIGVAGKPVKWSNSATGVNYTLVPGGGKDAEGQVLPAVFAHRDAWQGYGKASGHGLSDRGRCLEPRRLTPPRPICLRVRDEVYDGMLSRRLFLQPAAVGLGGLVRRDVEAAVG